MKVRIVLVALLTFGSSAAYAQCLTTLELEPTKKITISTCKDVLPVAEGDTLEIDASGAKLTVTAERVTDDLNLIIETEAVEEAANAIGTSNEVTIAANGKSAQARVIGTFDPRNVTKYSWSIGPATKGEEDGDDDDEDDNGSASILQDEPQDGQDDDDENTGALRFRYSGEYARGGFFGQGGSAILQTTASLSIDTTDQESTDFIDNNRLALGVNATRLRLGRLFMHGTAGVEARYEKGFHHSNRNADVVAKVTGWIPVARSLTLFPKDGVFIAPPLSFTASYGYRDKKVSDESGKGRVFEATALYHLFLYDRYQVDFSARLTHNDIDDLPAGTPKTQRMYKATVSYMADPESGFKVLTSFEDGSFGVMLKDVRQYFIGVAISKFNLAGSSENP